MGTAHGQAVNTRITLTSYPDRNINKYKYIKGFPSIHVGFFHIHRGYLYLNLYFLYCNWRYLAYLHPAQIFPLQIQKGTFSKAAQHANYDRIAADVILPASFLVFLDRCFVQPICQLNGQNYYEIADRRQLSVF